MSEVILEAKDIRKTYPAPAGRKRVEVLKGVDLKVEAGRFISIVGPSGAGKSTLLHILGGLDSPSRGTVNLGGDDLYKLGDTLLSQTRNQRVGFVFQFYHLLSEFCVLENVLMPALINSPGAGRQNSHTRHRASELLVQLGLGERMRHFPAQLSGGEQQRVAIVRALINQPKVLFCDEPTGNLDSACGNEIIGLIKKISLRDKMAVVLVTHNIELAKTADYIYNLRDGILTDRANSSN